MKKYLTIALLIAASLIIAGCANEKPAAALQSPEPASFMTTDFFEIKGTYYNSTGDAILLLHMLGRDRNDYSALAAELQKSGYAVLAIDSRGHGQSTVQEGREKPIKSFTEVDFRNMANDAAAAKKYLAEQKKKKLTAIIGASIGANTALRYSANEGGVKALVLLSPGENYRGVNGLESAQGYRNNILIIASEEDKYSADSSKKIKDALYGRNKLIMLKGKGHGTGMLDEGIDRQIIGWLEENT